MHSTLKHKVQPCKTHKYTENKTSITHSKCCNLLFLVHPIFLKMPWLFQLQLYSVVCMCVCVCVWCVIHPQQNRSWESQTTQNLLWPQQCMLLYWVFFWWQSYKLWKLFGARVEVVEKNSEQYKRPSSEKPISFGWISALEGTWLSPLWRDCVQAFIKIPSSGSQATSRWDLAHWITVHCVWQHTQGCQRMHPGWMITIPYETVWSRLWMAFSDSLSHLTLSHCLIVFQVNRLELQCTLTKFESGPPPVALMLFERAARKFIFPRNPSHQEQPCLSLALAPAK